MANKNNNGKAGAGIGLGLAALAAAAGAYYFYGSKHAAQHRKNMKGWMIKAKGEVVEKMENLKDITEDEYNSIVGQVAQKYSKMKKINPADVTAMAQDLRRHWKNISSQIRAGQPKRTRPKKVAAKKTK